MSDENCMRVCFTLLSAISFLLSLCVRINSVTENMTSFCVPRCGLE